MDYLSRLPVEWFIFLGAFVQEIVSPLPSFVVFVPGGASLEAHHASLGDVVLVAMLAAVGRVVAALLLYWVSGLLRTYVYSRKRRWLGISRQEIRRLEKRISGKQSWWAIFGLWALPVVPGLLVSLAGGFVRVPLWTFMSATYVGAIINALMYLLIGYFGLEATEPFGNLELILAAVMFAAIISAVIYALRRRKR